MVVMGATEMNDPHAPLLRNHSNDMDNDDTECTVVDVEHLLAKDPTYGSLEETNIDTRFSAFNSPDAALDDSMSTADGGSASSSFIQVPNIHTCIQIIDLISILSYGSCNNMIYTQLLCKAVE